jgi:hypothetical protein
MGETHDGKGASVNMCSFIFSALVGVVIALAVGIVVIELSDYYRRRK